MNLATINYLNIGFMILAGIVAFVLPFELALLSYVILGPLHYLTEIPWLQKRQFFMPRKQDYLWLALLASVIIFPTIFKVAYKYFVMGEMAKTVLPPRNIQIFVGRGSVLARVAAILAMASSVIFILTTDKVKRGIALATVFLWIYLFRSSGVTITFFILSLSMTHVYFFTGMFILSGALKSKSVSAGLSLLTFVICTFLVVKMPFYPNRPPGEYVINNYDNSFYSASSKLFSIFGHGKASHNVIYFSPAGIGIARLIGFAYFYHYLNWFSKTSIIGWHRISRKALLTIVLIWLSSISIYLIDFKLGLGLQFFLSTLHVILEYPLNFQSFRDVGKNLKSLTLKRKPQQDPAKISS